MDLELDIKNDSENKLLNRREIVFEVSYLGKTPTRIEIKEAICKKLNLNPDMTNVININQVSGRQLSNVLVYYHSDKDDVKRYSKSEKKKKGPVAKEPEKKEEKAEKKEERAGEEKKESKAEKTEKKEHEKKEATPKKENKE